METKLVRVPFEVELAKKITEGTVDGRIVTRDGRSARVVCWDLKAINKSYHILALIDNGNEEVTWTYSNNGRSNTDLECKHDLMLEIPEYMTFKDGDIIAFGYKDYDLTIGIFNKQIDSHSHKCYLKFNCYGYLIHDAQPLTYCNARFATEEEKQKLIDALKASKEPKAKEYLKRFFGIEEKKEYEFKPFDRVLVRDYKGVYWIANIFSNRYEIEGKVFYQCCGHGYKYCVPYNEKTAHLLGTTDDYNE